MSFSSDFQHIVDGKPRGSKTTRNVINPTTEEVLATVPVADRELLDETVVAASCAFHAWASTPMETRQAAVTDLGKLVLANLNEFAELLIKEVGKSRELANIETSISGAWLQGVAGASLPEEVLFEDDNRKAIIRYVPFGVCAAITPWNFPISLLVWKIAPALVTGNCVIVKPSPFAPLCAMKLVELAQQVLPPGVLSVLSGDDELGPWISTHPGISRISLTGSVNAGKSIMQSAASNLLSLTLELGGNDAALILPDVDPKSLAPKLFWSSFYNTGQICCAIKRAYIHEDVYEAVRDELVAFAKTVKIGNCLDPDVGMGPVQNRVQFEKVKSLIDDCREHGYTFALGGDSIQGPDGKGYFLPISIVDCPPQDSRIVQKEQFGPILPLLKWKDEDEVIKQINDSAYGLSGTIWTNDLDLAQTIARKWETGTVWINEAQAFHWDLPFGGFKHSGVGIEHGRQGLISWTNIQTITLNKART
ncbi:NAD-dependent succinate aldehyde dehydrogenase [Stereum hirsutum FP-91666 SS1]|uniref:NAD-dependent succinate aldehyde dehydrogenase n=1 Tax=Stereum hirsutum (strain FP-91666) TaxID=721885 RepID=UPI000444A305|nr:NAD-dependent succinate aldehyde dehydrogenase [Stereum hirsutum FP-91666 SS1]EIM82214.1 NAD-dependent succinate aldehyde dehydrogenase [Stereum hirsutum FP-91666 SS1]